MSERHYEAMVGCNCGQWVRIWHKESGELLQLDFSGTWRPNKYWGNVDCRGKAGTVSPAHYRGPGKPEVCVLVRLGEEGQPVEAVTGSPYTVAQELTGPVYLACNDDPKGLGDNEGTLQVVIRSSIG